MQLARQGQPNKPGQTRPARRQITEGNFISPRNLGEGAYSQVQYA
jgi:hypothetical protein